MAVVLFSFKVYHEFHFSWRRHGECMTTANREHGDATVKCESLSVSVVGVVAVSGKDGLVNCNSKVWDQTNKMEQPMYKNIPHTPTARQKVPKSCSLLLRHGFGIPAQIPLNVRYGGCGNVA